MTATGRPAVHGSVLRGTYAGAVTRLVAFAIDIATIWLLFSIGGAVAEYMLTVLLGHAVEVEDAPVLSKIALGLWAFAYMAYPLTVSGSTFGMAVLGVQVVEVDGTPVEGRHAAVRVLVLPLSILFFGIGMLLVLVRRDRRALHDLIARTAVVYSWDARPFRIGFLTRRSDRS